MAGEPLLRGVSFKLERRERLTLSGRNGSGKTTLLRMLAGETSVDSGELVFAKGTRIALHDQRPPRDRDLSLRDYVLGGCGDLIALEQELSKLEGKMAEGDAGAATLDAYSRAQGRLEHAGGYNWRERAMGVVRGLGFHDDDLDRRLDTFSGGELTRASLARTLAGDPDLLLLDEPTNHLDIESLEWLENQLTTIDAAVMLVAHDRWFLEAVGTAVLELEGGRGRFFKGPWHAWRKEQAARELALGRAIERQEAEIARLERFVTRFRAGTRARQAQSRAKKLQKMDRVARGPKDGKALGFQFEKADARRAHDRRAREGHAARGRQAAARGRRAVDRARRARHARRPERLRQDHADRDARGRARAGEGQAAARAQRGPRLPVAARRGARPRGHRARGGAARDRADAEQGARAAREVPLLRRGGREAARGPVRRRAAAALARGPRAQRLELPDHRRAHEPPGPREPRGARGRAARVRRHAAAGLARPRAARRRRHAHDRDRGQEAREPPGRLGRLPARARGAQGARRRPPKAAAKAEKKAKPKPAGVSKDRKRRIGALEREIETAEEALRTLEDELADPAAWASPTATERSKKRHDEAKRKIEELYERLGALEPS